MFLKMLETSNEVPTRAECVWISLSGTLKGIAMLSDIKLLGDCITYKLI